MNAVIGWTGAYDGVYPTVAFTEDRRKALIERIRKKNYSYNHFDHEMLPYGCPFYSDGVLCCLTKSQWDSVMNEVYRDMPLGERLMPMDVIKDEPVNGVLFEKTKFKEQFEGGGTNG